VAHWVDFPHSWLVVFLKKIYFMLQCNPETFFNLPFLKMDLEATKCTCKLSNA
jgi:hypothetical protein